MNSLVVFLSLVALAVAKPSGLLHGDVLTYSAPAFAAIPAAVSSQSRIDIKSSPAVVATAAVAPIAAVAPVARTVIAKPAIVAPVAIATPVAVSHQSRLDIKSSPAVVSEVVSTPYAAVAPAVLKTAIAAPVTYSAPAIAAPIAYAGQAIVAPAAIAAPATIAAASFHAETPEVIAARAAHFEAKAQAIAQQHFIHKRSATLIAPALHTTYAASPLISTYAATHVVPSAPLVHSAPLTYSAPIFSTPIVAKTYGVHAW